MRPGPLCVALVTSLVSLETTAQPPAAAALQLEWSAPAGCPRVDDVRALTAGLLGRPLTTEGPQPTRVRAQVRAAAGGYQMMIETQAPAGSDTRRLHDPRCVVLAEAAAMIAATAIDPSLAPPTLPPVAPDLVPEPGELSPGTGGAAAPSLPPAPVVGEPAPAADAFVDAPPEPTPAPAVAAAPELAEETGPAPPARVRVGLRVGGVFDVGSTPGPTGGLTVAAGLLGRLWRAELFGLWLAPRTHRPDPAVDLGAQVGLFAGGLRGCLVPTVRRLEIPVCAALEAGVLRGRGVGALLGAPAADRLPWVAASVGPGLAWSPVRRLALTLQVDLVVPVTPRAVFAVRDFGEVYRGAPVAGRATLGLELRFR